MEEWSEKVTKKDDRLLTINKEKEEMMKEVTVKQKKPYVAPTCEVIKLEGGTSSMAGDYRRAYRKLKMVEKSWMLRSLNSLRRTST